MKTLKRVVRDVKDLKNIEAYVVSLFAISLALAGLIEDRVSDDLSTTIILAALALLVFNITRPELEALTIDKFFQDRTKHTPFQDRVKGARKLWIYNVSVVSLMGGTNSPYILEILKDPTSEVYMVIQDPTDKPMLEYITLHLEGNIEVQPQPLPQSIESSITFLRNMQKMPQVQGKLEYRLLPYAPGFSVIAIDPDKNKGVVIVEIYGFGNKDVNERMHFELTKAQSEHWFDYWVNQFTLIWNKARLAHDVFPDEVN